MIAATWPSLTGRAACGPGVLRRVLAGALAEDDDVGKRVAAQPIGAVDARGALAGRKQAVDGGHLRIGIHLHAAHDVVRRRADLHRLPS